MKVAHHFNWHYAPMIGPFEDGTTQRWCKWCGFRESYKKCNEKRFFDYKRDGKFIPLFLFLGLIGVVVVWGGWGIIGLIK